MTAIGVPPSNLANFADSRGTMHAVSTIRPDISGGVGWDGNAIASNAISGQICDLTIRPWTFWLVTIRFPLRARFWRGWVATPIGLGRQTRSRMKSPQTCEICFTRATLSASESRTIAKKLPLEAVDVAFLKPFWWL